MRRSFPKPSEVETPPGAEGWRALYPYYLTFDDLQRPDEDERFWFCDTQHWPTVFKPFETVGAEFAVKCLGQVNARHLMTPHANGIEFRIHLGYLYLSPVPVDPAEVADRIPHFEERAAYYFENWEPLLDQWHVKVRRTIEEMESLAFEPLAAMVPDGDFRAGTGTDGSERLLANYDRLLQLAYQNWQYHFEFLNLGYIAYLDFFNFCNAVFPNIPDQSIAAMVQGLDLELFRPDDELKKLALLAQQLGLGDCFDDVSDADATLARIGAAPGGDVWLTMWGRAHDPWFNFTVGSGLYGHDRYWNTHPEIPLDYVKDYLRRLADGQEILRPVAALTAERERIIGEYRELLEGDARDAFDAKRQLAAMASPYVEDHNFYIEHWTMGVFWRKVRELSEVLVGAGFWERADDILYLSRNEVRDALFDYVTWWGVGARDAVGPVHWPPIIAERTRIVSALNSRRPQPAFNTPPEEVTDPFARMLWGISAEQLRHWLSHDEGESTGLAGMAASPGVAEGPARVITTADELPEVQHGEILVAPVTAPSWGPIFGKISGAVTDIGGMMSHAAIVCREYGLPAVTGTGLASTTIRTGQRLRVDGGQGTVEILDEPPRASVGVPGRR